MSYRSLRNYTVVVCDLCGARGAAGDHDWRKMRSDRIGQPIHLCPECRRAAIWCEGEGLYHRPEDNHRRACTDCGGLFTTKVCSVDTHCPGCRRDGLVSSGLPSSVRQKSVFGWLFRG